MFCMFIVFATVGYKVVDPVTNVPTQTGGYIMIVFGCLFILFYATTWAPVVWSVNGELYPTRVRAEAVGIATSSNWTWNFLLAYFTPYITSAIGFKYGYVFAVCSLTGAVIVYFFLYESRGLTLEQIDEMYGIADLKPWQSSKWEPTDRETLKNQRLALLNETNAYKRGQPTAQHNEDISASSQGV